MLTKKHKNVLQLQTNKFVETLMVGNYKTHFKNTGIEFADFREYQDSDDAKNIDWITSSKVGKAMMKLFDEQRELDVYFLPFFWEDLNLTFNGKDKREIFEEILYILWISTIKEQNKFWSVYYDNKKINIFPLGKSNAHFHDFFNKIENNNFYQDQIILNISQDKWNIIGNTISDKLKYFNSLKIKNNLVFLFTSDLEIDNKQLKIAALKNDLIICNVFHSFENSLEGNWIVWLKLGWKEIFIDLDNKKKKQEFQKLRKQKVIDFRKKILKSWAKYLYFDEKVNIFWELNKFFNNR